MFPFLSFNYYKHIVYFTLHFVKSILHLKAKKERNRYMMDTKSLPRELKGKQTQGIFKKEVKIL